MFGKKRWFSHPRSFFELVIAGFSTVTLPLLVAFVTGAFYVEKISNQSEEAVYRAVKATQTSRALLEQITAMERTIRQYFVLKDKALLQNYIERHDAYVETSSELKALLVDDMRLEQLRSLNGMESKLYEQLLANHEAGTAVEGEPMDFIALTELAQAILRDNNRLIDSEMAIMADLSQRARQIIFWELLAVVPGAVIFVMVFVVLLSRPVRQIDNAIRQLGAGQFEEEIRVNGPRDLAYLGERLDWLRARLKYLEEKKSKFLHYVSHELKTPLTAVREGAELLAEGLTGPLNEHQQDVTKILKKNSISLQTMIEKLLSFNTPGEASLSSGLSQLHMPHIVETVLADHKPVIMAKGIEMEVDCDDVDMHGDGEQVRVIIDNLLSNALKFTPENGRVELKLRGESDHVVIDVEDSGKGIAAEERDRVFEAFYQGSSSGQGMIRGSGLGLSIVQEFVEAHHGMVEVLEPTHLGGAHFRVQLPTEVVGGELAWAV